MANLYLLTYSLIYFVAKCQSLAEHSTQTIFEYGNPDALILIDAPYSAAYSYIDKFEKNFILQEYIIKLRPEGNASLVILDTSLKDVVTQNLAKERYWSYINSSGVVLSYVVKNSTWQYQFDFSTRENNSIAFYKHYLFESTQSQLPPKDVLIELPMKSESFAVQKTLLYLQNFGILNWRLSNDQPVVWETITNYWPARLADTKEKRSDAKLDFKDFKVLVLPCVPDIFILYVIGINEVGGINNVFIDMPLKPFVPGKFINITAAFCESYKDPDACGNVQQLIVTNNHIIALSHKGLHISAPLNQNKPTVEKNYENRSLINFDLIDPCKNALDYPCFPIGRTAANNLTFENVKLFYDPICMIWQAPFDEDMLSVVITHNSSSENSTEPAFTVLYSPSPYKHFFPLFHSKNTYGEMKVFDVVSVIFNFQLRRFDIIIKAGQDSSNAILMRILMPYPSNEKNKQGYEHLFLKDITGLLDFRFPKEFQMTGRIVNPGSWDILYFGNQIWVSESSNVILYRTFFRFDDEANFVTDCMINHPDRTFVCSSALLTQFLVGRITTKYQLFSVRITDIKELQSLAGAKGLLWPEKFFLQTISKLHVTVSYSGKIIIWYQLKKEELSKSQKESFDPNGKGKCRSPPSISSFNEVCLQLYNRYKKQLPKGDFKEDISGSVSIRMISINAHKLGTSAKPGQTVGPLALFLLDDTTALLYEGALVDEKNYNGHLSASNVGQKIICNGFRKSHKPGEVFIQHIKNVRAFLPGFNSVLYVKIVQKLPMDIIPLLVNITVEEPGNHVYVKIAGWNKLDAHEKYLGCSLYIPGTYSILLTAKLSDDRFTGLATRIFFQSNYISFPPYSLFRACLSTSEYQKEREVIGKNDDIDQKIEKKDHDIEKLKRVVENYVERFIVMKSWPSSVPPIKFETDIPKKIYKVRSMINTIISDIKKLENDKKVGNKPTTGKPNDWQIMDAGCNFMMELVKNPVLKGHGDKISLDVHDAISFEILLKPSTQLGKLLLHRNLLQTSNSNPLLLHVEKVYKKFVNFHKLRILLKPTGAAAGSASFVIRALTSSISCQTPSSITFIVQLHKEGGRSLLVNYPINICLAGTKVPRKWKKDDHNCIPSEDFLNSDKKTISRKNTDIMITLPPNYRPPSPRGHNVPTSSNVYNVHPELPSYHDWYHVSRISSDVKRCPGASRQQCQCSDEDKISDEEALSDCKEKVFAVIRGDDVSISVEYELLMRPQDQLKNFYLHDVNFSVYMEEINGRAEYTITDKTDFKTKVVNSDDKLNRGRTFHSAKDISITLLGTGLYHFKVGLGAFDSFEEVTGYFMLYSVDDKSNDVLLISIMFLTVSLAVSATFIAFLRVKTTLTKQVPAKPRKHQTKF